MELLEEKSLKMNIEELKKYLDNHKMQDSFYNSLEDLKFSSLQEISFTKDLDYFKEINSLGNVIISIISHPHLLNKSEEVIIKASQSSSLKEDAFQKTLKDARLWKNKDGIMTVEEVYNYVHEDEIRIYENIFVVMVIKYVDSLLSKYSTFYNSLISTVKNDTESLNNDDIFEGFEKLETVVNKFKNIKNTSFYKTISKNFRPILKVQPTNILLKDRLYNFVYKFYKKHIILTEEGQSDNDLKLYYGVLFIKSLKEKGFKLCSTNVEIKDNIDSINLFEFIKDDIKVSIKNSNDNSLELIINDECINSTIKHLVLIEQSYKFDSYRLLSNDNEYKEYDTVETISLWNIANIKDLNKVYFTSRVKEIDLVNSYISSKLTCVEGSFRIYSKYCPICKNKNIEINDDLCTCNSCGSKYHLFKKNDKEYLFFRKIRRL